MCKEYSIVFEKFFGIGNNYGEGVVIKIGILCYSINDDLGKELGIFL